MALFSHMPGGRRFFQTNDKAPERPADPAVRKANLHRIVRLFFPYRARLGATLGLILFSAGIGVISPFLLRGILDTAIPDQDRELLTVLVVGMIAIAIVTGVLSVAQTWLSNVVGQKVMHDLMAEKGYYKK